MYKSRSPFQIPQVPGSSMKRKQDERNKYQMSIQKPRQESKAKEANKNLNAYGSLSSLPSTYDEKFCFNLDDPLQTDARIYWTYDVQNQVSNQVSRKIIFREQQYYIRSTADSQIFQTIYLTADGIQGFRDKSGNPTTRVCALHLTSINSLIDDSQDKTYDLLYKQTQDFSWQIPMSLGQMRLGISFDDALQTGTLAVPLVCQFDIRHTAR